MAGKAYTIVVDTREKTPFPIPRNMPAADPASPATSRRGCTHQITIVKKQLLFGDYVLEGSETRVVIERKKNLRELATNVLDPKRRQNFVTELRRMRDECSNPVLILEGSPLSLETSTLKPMEKNLVRDGLLALLFEYGIHFIMLPTQSSGQRMAAGRWVASMLIAGESHGNRWNTHPSRNA